MEKIGYLPTDDNPNLVFAHESCIYNHIHHIGFYKKGSSVNIEIHERLSSVHDDFEAAALGDLFNDACELLYEGVSLPTLDPADHALFQIAHGTGHLWCLLHWVLDLAVLARRGEPEVLERIAQCARAKGLEKIIALGLNVVTTIYAIEVPPAFLSLHRRWGKKLKSATAFALSQLRNGGFSSNSITASLLRKVLYLPSISPTPAAAVADFMKTFKVNEVDLRMLSLPRMFQNLSFILRPVFLFYRKFALFFCKIERILQGKKKRGLSL